VDDAALLVVSSARLGFSLSFVKRMGLALPLADKLLSLEYTCEDVVKKGADGA
jgi:hypothetical protein